MNWPRITLLIALMAIPAGTVQAACLGNYDALSSVRGITDQCSNLDSAVTEFSNGNTFVQYNESVAGMTVAVRVPHEMTTNVLMEALLRVRTLQGLGAAKVDVLVIGESDSFVIRREDGQTLSLPVELLFSASGASTIMNEKGSQKDLTFMALNRQHELLSTRSMAATELWISAGQHSKMAVDLGQELNAPILSPGAPVSGKKVILLAAPLAPVNDSLFETFAELFHLTQEGAMVHLVSPYLPYARSDKQDQPGVIVGGRLIADLITVMGARSMTFARAHAPQGAGFYQIPTAEVSSFETLVNGIKNEKIDLFVAPDNGAVKDTTKAALSAKKSGALPAQVPGISATAVPVGLINKERDGSKIRIHGMHLPGGLTSLKGLRVLILDDETASGSTLAEAAHECRRQGASFVAVAVTHLAGSANRALDSQDIDAIYVTDSIPVSSNHAQIHVLSLAPELAQVIRYRIQPTPRHSCPASLISASGQSE